MTRSAKARSSGRSASCARRSCPRSSSTASPPISTSSTVGPGVGGRTCACGAVIARPGCAPAERAGIEREFLAALPRLRFDTDYVETRRVHQRPVHRVSTVSATRSRRTCLGQLVEIRRPVDSDDVRGPLGRQRRGPPHDRSWRRHRGRGTWHIGLGRRSAGVDTIGAANAPPARGRRGDRDRRAGCRTGRLELGDGDFDVAAARPRRPLRDQRQRGRGVTATGIYEQIKDDSATSSSTGPARCSPPSPSNATAPTTGRTSSSSPASSPSKPTATRNRRLAARLRYARFPFRKTIDDFDFEFQPSSTASSSTTSPPCGSSREPADPVPRSTRLRQDASRCRPRHPRRRGRLPRLLHHRRGDGRQHRPSRTGRRHLRSRSCGPTPPRPCSSSTTSVCCR